MAKDRTGSYSIEMLCKAAFHYEITSVIPYGDEIEDENEKEIILRYLKKRMDQIIKMDKEKKP